MAECEAAIDRQIETVLGSDSESRIPLARSVMTEFDDRWYGQLLALSYGSAADRIDDETVYPATAAIELLRGYCRLRSELLQQNDAGPRSLDRYQTVQLLAGDYLHALAYSTLSEIDHPALDACYTTLTTTSARIIKTLYSSHEQSASSSMDFPSVLDGTVGRLGEGAAVIGATLAGVDEPHREYFGTLGQGLSTARQIEIAHSSESKPHQLLPPIPNSQRLRKHATCQSMQATEALQSLKSIAAVDRLRPLIKEIRECER